MKNIAKSEKLYKLFSFGNLHLTISSKNVFYLKCKKILNE